MLVSIPVWEQLGILGVQCFTLGFFPPLPHQQTLLVTCQQTSERDGYSIEIFRLAKSVIPQEV